MLLDLLCFFFISLFFATCTLESYVFCLSLSSVHQQIGATLLEHAEYLHLYFHF